MVNHCFASNHLHLLRKLILLFVFHPCPCFYKGHEAASKSLIPALIVFHFCPVQ